MAIHCCHGFTIALVLIAAIFTGVSVGVAWTHGTTSSGGVTVDLKLFNFCVDGSCTKWSDAIQNNDSPYCLFSSSSNSAVASSSGGGEIVVTSNNGITNANALAVLHVVQGVAIVAIVALIGHAAVLTAWAMGSIRSGCAPITTAILSMILSGGAAVTWVGFEHLCHHTPCEKIVALMMLATDSSSGQCREYAGFGLDGIAAIIAICSLFAFCARRPSDAIFYQQLVTAQSAMIVNADGTQLYAAVPVQQYGQQVVVYGQQPLYTQQQPVVYGEPATAKTV